MAASCHAALAVAPLPVRERVDRPQAETGEGFATGPSAYPLIRPFGAPSPARGEGWALSVRRR